MKTALVTGGAGFIGSHLSARLLADGFRVVALDNLYTGSSANVASLKGDGRFSLVVADVCDLEVRGGRVFERSGREIEELSGGVDEIYNLACPASPVHYQARPLFTTLTTIKGVLFCLDLARSRGVRLLHASTSEIYGDPIEHPQQESHWGNVNTIGVRSCYDEGKRVAETLVSDYIREYGIDARMVRIFNTYGPRMHPQDGRVVSNFIVQALAGRDMTVYGDGSQTRSFQYCTDFVEAARRYMELPKERVKEFFAAKGLGAPVLNIGNPGEFTIRELAEKTLAMIPESRSRVVYMPLPGDDPKKRRPDISLAAELLGWRPVVPLEEGLAKTIEYFRNQTPNTNKEQTR